MEEGSDGNFAEKYLMAAGPVRLLSLNKTGEGGTLSSS
jgi:hypothetical protein